MIRLLVAFALTLALAAPARAVDVPGAGDPAFVAAKDRYLAGEVLAAVRELLRLAPDNDAAALLLGVIDIRETGSELRTLPFKERRELLKAPSGWFGRSWLAVLADRNPVAGALATRNAKDALAAARKLAEAGEITAAANSYLTALNRGDWDGIVAEHVAGRLPEELRWVAWSAAVMQLRADGPTEGTQALLAELDRSRSPWAEFALQFTEGASKRVPPPAELVNGALLLARNPADREVALSIAEGWLEDAPEFETHRLLCERRCPTSQNACRRAAYMAGGGLGGVLALGSPSERLVLASEWRRSPRAQGMLLDFAAGLPIMSPRGNGHERLAKVDACFAALVPKRP